LATADLGGLGLTSNRGAAIKAFARAVADDTIRLDRGSKLDQLIGLVTTIPGLGPWTAHYLALRLGEPDAFPATDLGLRRSLSRIVGQPLTPRAAEGVAERWRPWRAHAAVHLWQGGIGR
jgi:AraC family transcriptional regulator of adaptative response / DNA-3-methyladenine glycosylase II